LCAFAFLFFSDAANSAARSSSHDNNNDSASEELELLLLTVLYHHLLVASSSMPLLESRYSLALLWSAYDYSIAVATATGTLLTLLLLLWRRLRLCHATGVVDGVFCSGSASLPYCYIPLCIHIFSNIET
jgi:hypothetical protein